MTFALLKWNIILKQKLIWGTFGVTFRKIWPTFYIQHLVTLIAEQNVVKIAKVSSDT